MALFSEKCIFFLAFASVLCFFRLLSSSSRFSAIPCVFMWLCPFDDWQFLLELILFLCIQIAAVIISVFPWMCARLLSRRLWLQTNRSMYSEGFFSSPTLLILPHTQKMNSAYVSVLLVNWNFAFKYNSQLSQLDEQFSVCYLWISNFISNVCRFSLRVLNAVASDNHCINNAFVAIWMYCVYLVYMSMETVHKCTNLNAPLNPEVLTKFELTMISYTKSLFVSLFAPSFNLIFLLFRLFTKRCYSQ